MGKVEEDTQFAGGEMSSNIQADLLQYILGSNQSLAILFVAAFGLLVTGHLKQWESYGRRNLYRALGWSLQHRAN